MLPTGIKVHNPYAKHSGACTLPLGSRMVTVTCPRWSVVYP